MIGKIGSNISFSKAFLSNDALENCLKDNDIQSIAYSPL